MLAGLIDDSLDAENMDDGNPTNGITSRPSKKEFKEANSLVHEQEVK
jgi:hypothetical protein